MPSASLSVQSARGMQRIGFDFALPPYNARALLEAIRQYSRKRVERVAVSVSGTNAAHAQPSPDKARVAITLNPSLHNQRQETAFSVQVVPGMRFLVFDFAVCNPCTRHGACTARFPQHACCRAEQSPSLTGSNAC
eukprot:958735-Rhodomonas_salina.1